MIRNILSALLLMIICSCSYRASLPKQGYISYKSTDIEATFHLEKIKKIKKMSWEKGDFRYFYYGTMTAQLYSIKNPKELTMVYNGEESEVYLDTIASTINFWDYSWWDQNGFRKNKVYISFDDPNVDWNAVKIIEKKIPKKITRETICKITKESSSRNFEKYCISQ